MRAARHLGDSNIRAVAPGIRRPLAVEDLGLPRSTLLALNDWPMCRPGQDVDMEGQRRNFECRSHAENGQRNITLDLSTGLITDETMDALPEPYRVGRYGASPNQVAITFDDGPDPQWTPKILDILKREHATATFFLIGNEAESLQCPHRADLSTKDTRSAITLTPILTSASLSNFAVELELNLTERLFASRLGIRTLLFRPPYSIDAEPDTEDRSAAAGDFREERAT